MVLFGWTALEGVVSARNSCGRAISTMSGRRARSGVNNITIMRRHVLPNAMVATLTFLPIILTGSITSADGARLPRIRPAARLAFAGRAAEAQGKAEFRRRPGSAVTASLTIIVTLLSLLIFVGEGVRDAFDPRRDGERRHPAAGAGSGLGGYRFARP